jgi:hypothetical protein
MPLLLLLSWLGWPRLYNVGAVDAEGDLGVGIAKIRLVDYLNKTKEQNSGQCMLAPSSLG